jgi:predicted short-subunit dehydrogenase-like oxidoreductase (DUF2520 family)
MAEVLDSPRLRVGLIGAGRAGTVVARALERVGHHCVATNAVSEASRQRVARMLPSADVVDSITVCAMADLIVVAVPDDAIESVVAGLVSAGAITARHMVMHLSGRHGAKVLQAASEAGATVFTAHPAMTLHGRVEDVQRLEECPFGVTANYDALAIAMALVYEIGGVPSVIAEADRVLYHAALAHASNHTVTLVAQSMEMLRLIGVDTPGRYLEPLVKATVERVLQEGDAALTGPIARGDVETVHAHLDAIDRTALPPSTAATYRALANATAARHHKDLGTL